MSSELTAATERIRTYLEELDRTSKYNQFADAVHSYNDYDLRRSDIRALLDEITTLRAEVADRDARVTAVRKLADESGPFWMVAALDIQEELDAPAVPVPQDNPEATRSDIADEISGVPVGYGYESTTIGIAAALEAADLILAAFDVRLSSTSDSAESCTDQKWSWDYFSAEQVDPYWMRCDLAGKHDEHVNSETGATWKPPVSSPDVRPKNGEKP